MEKEYPVCGIEKGNQGARISQSAASLFQEREILNPVDKSILFMEELTHFKHKKL